MEHTGVQDMHPLLPSYSHLLSVVVGFVCLFVFFLGNSKQLT